MNVKYKEIQTHTHILLGTWPTFYLSSGPLRVSDTFPSSKALFSVSASLPLGKRHGSSGWALHIETARLCVNEGLWVCDRSCYQQGEKQDVTQLDLSPKVDTHSEPFPGQRQHKPWDPWNWIHAALLLSSPRCRNLTSMTSGSTSAYTPFIHNLIVSYS